ncbi:MAG: hypothetical protein FE78DRAFT_104838 [Acidomyces sp. 'richmondensis']|nr:MAG: hypothetical protein FE78DRAFT_104838 [Acidomyces sp. 'richmondensis']
MKQSSLKVPLEPLAEHKNGENGYHPLDPRTELLRQGWNGFGSREIQCDILVEHDFCIPVREGCNLYGDVYRPPAVDAKVPAILCWSPFGKKLNGLDSLKLMTPWNLGIQDGALSGLEKFEAPDPTDWVPRGYAIVNVDSRGSFNSKVGLAGNSHLAIIQWVIAALQTPSLQAIAPWEGCEDLYREQFVRGGIYGGDLFYKLIKRYMLRGRNGLEIFRKMFEEHPLTNDWWQDKRPDMTKIRVSTYITGTWTNTMHRVGAIRGWIEIDEPQKWLRFHPWRECLPLENVIVEDFPVSKTQYRKAFLHPDGELSFDTLPKEAQYASYNSQIPQDFVSFRYTFGMKMSILGMSKAMLHMSCPDHDDMDIFVLLRKLSATGDAMLALNIPWKGIPISTISEIPEDKQTEVILYAEPTGILRASMRAIDWSRSTHENWPYHPMDKRKYHQGNIQFQICGHYQGISNFGTSNHVQNKGIHFVHFGGEYDSNIVLPFN